MPDETAWLIEETWSGFIHYIHRDFDAEKWVRETASLSELPYQWMPSGTRGATLTRRKPTIPFITKNASEAMRFASRADAEAWLSAQPSWLSCTTQHQPREHMWPETVALQPKEPDHG
ncbi:MAG TPA: hypothetical protein VL358_04805 [Caulobacteraceae bacterium]|jgi:hypothetical protein|nr:hypothetical protein [Caulobacteraceae bacterium]